MSEHDQSVASAAGGGRRKALAEDLKERYGVLLSIEQLAELLGRPPRALRESLNLANSPLGPLATCRQRMGRRIYFLPDDVAAAIVDEDRP